MLRPRFTNSHTEQAPCLPILTPACAGRVLVRRSASDHVPFWGVGNYIYYLVLIQGTRRRDWLRVPFWLNDEDSFSQKIKRLIMYGTLLRDGHRVLFFTALDRRYGGQASYPFT